MNILTDFVDYIVDLVYSIPNLFSQMPGAIGQGLIWGIMAIGLYITYRILEVSDLTVDGSIATGGAVTAILIINGWNSYAAVMVAFGVGMLTGLATGLFHTKLGIPAILAGILTQLALYSVNLGVMNGAANTPVSVDKYSLMLSSRDVLSLSLKNPILPLIVMCVLVCVLLFLFFSTEYGCALRATGANLQMSRAQGINTDMCKIVGLMLSNGIVAFAGALLSQYQGYADVNMGRGAIVVGLAAVIIGEAVFGRYKLFRSFHGKLAAVCLGAIVYYMVLQIVIWIGLDTNYMKLLTALLVAMFLGVPNLQAKRAASQIARKEVKTDA